MAAAGRPDLAIGRPPRTSRGRPRRRAPRWRQTGEKDARASWLGSPWIGQLWVRQKFLVGQAFEKLDDVGLFGGGKGERRDEIALVGVVRSDARVWAGCDG